MNLGKAIAIAANGFKDKTDRSGEPYIMHCIRVMNQMDTDEERIVAILHDVVEDGVATLEELLTQGLSAKMYNALYCLTHNKKDDYLDVYIKRISLNPLATKVKLADLRDNSNITRLKGLTKKDFDRMEKYHKAYTYLSKI